MIPTRNDSKRVFELVETLVSEIKLERNNQRHIEISLLYANAVNIAKDIETIIFKESSGTSEILLRSLFECYADLVNCCQIPDYHKRLEVNDLNQGKKILDYLLLQNNSSFRASEIQEMIEGNNDRQKILQNSGIKEIRIRQKFNVANLESDYDMLYAHLCTRAHGNSIMLPNGETKN